MPIIYTLSIWKAGKLLFSYDIVLVEGVPFDAQWHEAYDTFRREYPDVSLMDDDVDFSTTRKRG